MNTQQETRKYNCKDEELIPICKYAAFSLKRDLNDFTAYSPKINDAYVAAFEEKIGEVSEVLNPKIETIMLKSITAELYEAMTGLIDPINKVGGYLKLAGASVPVSAKDFGLPMLRKKANAKDAEGVVQGCKLVHANLLHYKAQLAEQGLTDVLIAVFETTAATVAEKNQKQYEIISSRKNIVQNNLNLFNELFLQLSEICEIGKILYKGKDALKLREYTFTELKKNVRTVAKATKEEEV